jgi:monoamine oxidase
MQHMDDGATPPGERSGTQLLSAHTRVVVLGGGIAGLAATRELERAAAATSRSPS